MPSVPIAKCETGGRLRLGFASALCACCVGSGLGWAAGSKLLHQGLSETRGVAHFSGGEAQAGGQSAGSAGAWSRESGPQLSPRHLQAGLWVRGATARSRAEWGEEGRASCSTAALAPGSMPGWNMEVVGCWLKLRVLHGGDWCVGGSVSCG